MLFETIIQYAAHIKIHYFCQIFSQHGCVNICNCVVLCYPKSDTYCWTLEIQQENSI